MTSRLDEICGSFIAGTLVQTKDGLSPIDEIRAGDLVLSRPEMGGENAYKRVVKAIRHTSSPVLVNKYMLTSPREDPLQKMFHIASTLDHPFWLNGVGWTAAKRLDFDGRDDQPMLSLADGGSCWFWTSSEAYSTNKAELYVPERADMAQGGDLLDLQTNKFGKFVAFDWDHWTDDGNTPKLALCDVYSIEVEEYHTYFVGEHGVWVRDANRSQPAV